MSDYTKITDFSQKDVVQALIEGVDFDNEFTAVSQMSTTKADKITPASADSVAGLNAAGNLTDSGILISDVNTALQETVVVAAVLTYAGSGAPTGYLVADGRTELTAGFPDLFGVIGYTYGGSGANFDMPDLRGRVAAGPDNMGGTLAGRILDTQALNAGGAMGSERVTLTTAMIPAHSHAGTTNSAGNHSHTGWVGTSSTGASGDNKNVQNQFGSTSTAGAHTHPFTTNTDGGTGGDHQNVQPTLFLNWIIKT